MIPMADKKPVVKKNIEELHNTSFQSTPRVEFNLDAIWWVGIGMMIMVVIAAIFATLWYKTRLDFAHLKTADAEKVRILSSLSDEEYLLLEERDVEFFGEDQSLNTREGWSSYRNEKFGFDVQHPDDWTINEVLGSGPAYESERELSLGIRPPDYEPYTDTDVNPPQISISIHDTVQSVREFLDTRFADNPSITSASYVESSQLGLSALDFEVVSSSNVFNGYAARSDERLYYVNVVNGIDPDIADQILSTIRLLEDSLKIIRFERQELSVIQSHISDSGNKLFIASADESGSCNSYGGEEDCTVFIQSFSGSLEKVGEIGFVGSDSEFVWLSDAEAVFETSFSEGGGGYRQLSYVNAETGEFIRDYISVNGGEFYGTAEMRSEVSEQECKRFSVDWDYGMSVLGDRLEYVQCVDELLNADGDLYLFLNDELIFNEPPLLGQDSVEFTEYDRVLAGDKIDPSVVRISINDELKIINLNTGTVK